MSKYYNGKEIFRSEENAVMKIGYDIAKEDFAKAGKASSSIKKVLKQLGIDQVIIRKVAIATYEAEINVVIHSLGGHIDVFIKNDKIEIYVDDNGPGIEDVELAMKEGFSTATHKVRELGFGAGMGLPNIERCSDEFYLNSEVGGSTKVKMVMFL